MLYGKHQYPTVCCKAENSIHDLLLLTTAVGCTAQTPPQTCPTHLEGRAEILGQEEDEWQHLQE